MTSIYPYQTQQVRDLAWACFSPSLLLTQQLGEASAGAGNCIPALTSARQAWLHDLDRDATALLQHLAQRPSHRLGVYFEQLWHFLLEQDPGMELVAHNLPIHDRGRTLGEFDCIYYCRRRQQHVHLELAVKYFLGHRQHSRGEQPSQLREWLGPNTADRLDLKVAHLLQRQIRLADLATARQKLHELGIDELAREVEVKGYLFQHLDDPLAPPLGFNPQRSMHTWVRMQHLSPFLNARPDHGYLPLQRLRWLSPSKLEAGEKNLEAGALQHLLQSHFSDGGGPQLVAALDGCGNEVDRFFVTSDSWPNSGPVGTASDYPDSI